LVGCVVTACQRQDRGDGQGAEKERSNDGVTEKEIAQVYFLRKEIKMWEEELRKLGLYRSPAFDGIGGGSAVSNPTAAYVERCEKLRAIIDGKKSEIEIQERAITDYIMSVTDSWMRQILYMRHIKLYSWRQIARHMGGNNTEDGIRMAHKRFFHKK
jgi:hypothetical protein